MSNRNDFMANNKNHLPIKLDRIYKDKDWKLFKNTPVIPLGAETDTHNLIATLKMGISIITAGKPGSGQTTFIHSAIINLLRNTKPEDLKMILIDVKNKDLQVYNGLPNLIFPVANTQEDSKKIVDWCSDKVDQRLGILIGLIQEIEVTSYSLKMLDKLFPRILVVIDGYHDLVKGDSEYFLQRFWKIVGLGSMVNVHVLMTNSKPLYKRIYPKSLIDTFPLRIAFSSSADVSKALVKSSGGDKLKQVGEMLFREFEVPTSLNGKRNGMPVSTKPNHLQGFYISEKEIKKELKSFIK